MPERYAVAPRLVGICKTCHVAKFGYLVRGVGPFTCFECATARSQPLQSNSGSGTWSFTFTTSNSSGVDPNEQQH